MERDVYPLAAWLRDAEEDYREVSGRLPASARRRIEGFLGRTPPVEPRTEAFCHNDLGAEHVLTETTLTTGPFGIPGLLSYLSFVS